MIKRILVYGFPFFLVLLERILRDLFQLDSKAFIGPAIASAGVVLLLPLIAPKPLKPTPSNINLIQQAATNKIALTSEQIKDLLVSSGFLL